MLACLSYLESSSKYPFNILLRVSYFNKNKIGFVKGPGGIEPFIEPLGEGFCHEDNQTAVMLKKEHEEKDETYLWMSLVSHTEAQLENGNQTN